MYRFRDTARYLWKVENFSYPTYIWRPIGSLRWSAVVYMRFSDLPETRLRMYRAAFLRDMFGVSDRTPLVTDRQTDRHIQDHSLYRTSIASAVKFEKP